MPIRATVSVAALLIATFGVSSAYADEAAAKKWIDSEFQPSSSLARMSR